ncbi:MAG: ras guanine nucleotide exchange factor domain-containing protein [Benniella sp.]|nr:MAG: ras guanine nucleotide exchange factor domain-containing protein [Benniella sp.]
MPTTEASQIKEEIVVPTSHSSRHRFEQDPDAPPTPSLRPQYTSQSSSSMAGSRSPRTRATDSSSRSSGRRGMPNRNERPRSPVAAEPESNAIAKDSDGVGLGVNVPTETRQRSSTAASRTSRATGSRGPVPPSSNPEASKRMQRQEQQPRPHSPNPSSDLRPFSRNSNHSYTSLNPAGMPSSRRGSQTSIHSDGTAGRRSNDSQRPKDHEHQDRRQQPNQSGSRRGSNSGYSGSTLRVEHQTKGDDVLSGLSTPSTPHVQTFMDGSSSHRSGRNLHRESIQSILSVATESSVQSRTGENKRPVSPALRNRNVQLEDGSTKGRVSNESNRGSDKQQHHPPQSQQAKGASGAAYRPRPNKVGQDNTAVSNEDSKLETPLSEPWFLNYDYEADEVLYNDNGTFVAATLDAYIEMLTSHKNTPEPMFVATFFTTFRLFTDPVELVQLLIKRFVKSPPAGLNEQEYTVWQQQKQERIQKRVHIALKTWLEGYWVSEKDRFAFKPIMDFVKQEMMEAIPGPAGRLLDMLNQWVSKRKSLHFNNRSSTIGKSRSHERINQLAQENGQQSPTTGGSSSSNSISNAFSKPFATVKEKYSADQLKNSGKRGIPFTSRSSRDSIQGRGPPVPLVNKALLSALANEQTMTKVPITDIKPVELARQLTIMVGKLFLEIPYLELLGRDRPNCSRMVQLSNKITSWVTDTVVDEQDVKKRIGVVKHWIEVGEECLKLNNFDTLTAISCAIESTPVRRLHNTWEGISKAYIERAEQLRKTISSEFNYTVYRAKLKTVQAPCIPFLGLYFTVIAYIEDGNSIYKEPNPTGTTPNSSSSSSSAAATNVQQLPITPTPTPTRRLLRYGRFAQLARAVQEFRDFQGVYELLEVPRLRDYILKCMENQDSERNYRKSLAIEPRRPTAGVIQSPHGANNGPNIGSQRSNSSNKGVSNSEMNNGGMGAGGNTKLNKLSFFRKSTRYDRS